VNRACDGTFIGWCSLNRWNPDYRSASLGYCFGEAAWGRGYATEAARALLRWAFGTLDRIRADQAGMAVISPRAGRVRAFDCWQNGKHRSGSVARKAGNRERK
jgi:[ribosomal protein S5]-alanine N-acetyltransferase